MSIHVLPNSSSKAFHQAVSRPPRMIFDPSLHRCAGTKSLTFLSKRLKPYILPIQSLHIGNNPEWLFRKGAILMLPRVHCIYTNNNSCSEINIKQEYDVLCVDIAVLFECEYFLEL